MNDQQALPTLPVSVLEAVGGRIVRGLTETGRTALMMLAAARWIVRGRLEGAEFVVQVNRIGVDSLYIVLVTGAFTGLVLAYQTARQFLDFGAQTFVGGLVGVTMAREAGPVFTALTAAGWVSAGIAAELGTMAVTEQIDALRVLATDPVRYLVVPRLAAAAVAMPLLTIFSTVVGGIGGYAVATAAGISSGTFIVSLQRYLYAYDLWAGLVKAFCFGLIIAAVGCSRGLEATGGADGVGRATRSAVVTAILWILVCNFFLDLIFF